MLSANKIEIQQVEELLVKLGEIPAKGGDDKIKRVGDRRRQRAGGEGFARAGILRRMAAGGARIRFRTAAGL